MRGPSGRRLHLAALLVVIAGTLLVPLGLRTVNRFLPNSNAAPSYIPDIETPRERVPFEAEAVDNIRGAAPDYVVIGDSMAGTRIDERHLTSLVRGRGVSPILHPGVGSAYWYLVFKNWIVASQIHPKAVIFFFRDENLTDPMFRVYPGSLDRVALATEPILNDILAANANGTWYRVHAALGTVYQGNQTRAWLEPLLLRTPVPLAADRGSRARLLDRMNNELFNLNTLRPMPAADMATGADIAFDFQKNGPRSVLPEIVRLARRSRLRLAFIRVQRRPLNNRPPVQSPALQRYVQDLETYLVRNGAYFHDDWGDPDQPLSIYEDGDHIARGFRRYYTELFYRKNPDLFPMIFHSLEFLIFFVVTVTLYWALTFRWQNVLLLVGSYVFYGWVHPWFLTLIFATTFIDYCSARGMDLWPKRKKAFLWASIITNFGLLGFFKYFNFFVDNVAAVAAVFGMDVPRPMLSIFLPVGISFYTFQSMSYTIDVYWNHAHARKSFLDVAAFVSFFPHLVAGPIMRATNLLPQVEHERRFSVSAARDATLLIVWGLFKKLVIADNVGVIANKVFALKAPDFYLLWAGVFAFCIQIYADFSAYTDIARGTAKWFGFDLIRNFDHPYLATSPTDFWRRWNISLSSWFRDYVYIPLGGSRHGPWKQARNVMVTFLLSGLWHGASWNYVIWGFYHGLLLVLTRVADTLWSPSETVRRRLIPMQIAGMFVVTNVGWLIFRETELSALVRDFTLMPSYSLPLERQAGAYLFLLAFLYSIPLWIQSMWAEWGGPDLGAAMTREEARPDLRMVAAQAALAGLMFTGILVLRSHTALDFIYFQF